MDGETGEDLWSQHFTGPGDYNESVHSIACDDLGNAFVTGRAYNGSNGYDIITLKLDASDGDVVWSDFEGGTDDLDDCGWSIVVGPDNHPVITGVTINNDGTADYTTYKLDNADRSTLWIEKWPGAINNVDERAGWLSVCDDGDVVMANRTWESGTSYDAVLHRYSAANGDTVWTARYGSSGNAPDNPQDMARDAAGNILVAGVRSGDYMVLKFDSITGELIWPAHYDGPANGYDTANCVMEGPGGVVIASGFASGDGTGWDATTIALDPADGALLWDMSFDGGDGRTDEATALAASESHDLYVVGYAYGTTTDQDLLSLRYNLDTTSVFDGVVILDRLVSAHPNPFSNQTSFSLARRSAGPATIGIYDMRGRCVSRLHFGSDGVGSQRVVWNGRDIDGSLLPAGVYVARAEERGSSSGIKIVLTR